MVFGKEDRFHELLNGGMHVERMHLESLSSSIDENPCVGVTGKDVVVSLFGESSGHLVFEDIIN